MVYIIVGQSGSGKTTYVKKNLLKEPYEYLDYGIPCTKGSNGVIALGKYGIGIRTEGTDTLSYNSQDKIKKAIAILKDNTIVLEGDRITNSSIIDYIIKLGVEAEIILITCSLKTSIKRLREAGSNISLKFVKATKTKSRNLFIRYEYILKGKVINTDE